jgi:hypothetical protein
MGDAGRTIAISAEDPVPSPAVHIAAGAGQWATCRRRDGSTADAPSAADRR